jgi:flagellar basal-body rod protein FlgF
MENTTYISLSLQTALQKQMDMVANNIANMTTAGFKNKRMIFMEYLMEPKGETGIQADRVSMVLDYGSFRDLREGPQEQTGNPLDIALKGEGYLSVQTAQGERFSRGGRLQLNNERTIVDSAGTPVLDQAGQPIQVPETARAIRITGDGVIQADGQQIGQFKVTRFDKPQFLREVSAGQYDNPDDAAGAQQGPGETRVLQGVLEGSNVSAVLEMTEMINIQRQYRNVQRMIEGEHQRIRDAMSRITRIS